VPDVNGRAGPSSEPSASGHAGRVDRPRSGTAGANHRRTRAAHAGEDPSAPVRPLVEPISPSTVYAFRDPSLADRRRAADPPEPNYGRDGLPNVDHFERAIAELEGAAEAHAVASGMAAIGLVFLAHLDAGDHVVASADCYCDTQSLLSREMTRFGVETSFVDATDPAAIEAAITPRTRLVYAETISNPGMKLVDLELLGAIAHRHAALLCVDNTFATPMLCRPLEQGADLVVHSATKYLGGHHDLTAGVVAGAPRLIGPIRRCGYRFGPTLGPFDAWLALRGVKTLAPRMAWISATALRVAAFLRDHPEVSRVRYPGLPDHPQAALAGRLLPDGAGGMLAFDLDGGADAAAAMIAALRLIPYAPSLGGPTTTVSYPPQDLSATVGEDDSYCCGTVRLSIGLEAASDVIADLDRALAAVAAAPAPAPALEVRP
jgi:cystathionine beta-lyase/cystathionine gamma-synthase